jgi:catechol 2,3-dioxygenase
MQLGHVHLKVRDLERSIDFYTHFLGLKLNERVKDQYAFLSFGSRHHDLALQSVGKSASLPASTCAGLYILAFEVPDQETLLAAYTALETAGIETVLVDHLISWAMDFSDPDGNGIEIYWDTRHEPGGQSLWHGRNLVLPAHRLSHCLDNAHQVNMNHIHHSG